MLRFVWSQYRTWAITSRALKARLTKSGLIVLYLTVGGTAIGALSPLLAVPANSLLTKVLPWVAAVSLGIAAYLTSQLLSESERQAWAKARAVAEALKSESYKYLTAAPPYDAPNAAQLLGRRVEELQRVLPGILPEQIPAEESARGMPEGPMTVSDYSDKRIREQIANYYRPAIVRHRAALSQAKTVVLAVGIVAVVLSAGVATIGSWAAAGLGIVTTAAATLGAWFQSGRHQQIALNYQAAITKLELLLAGDRTTGLAEKQLVVEAEAVFQAEHAAWLAEWQSVAPPASSEKVVATVPAETP